MTFAELLERYKTYNFVKNKESMNKLSKVRSELYIRIFPILASLEEKGWRPAVVQGVRTLAEQREILRKGNSQTMRSKHLIGAAVDIVHADHGWDGPAANLGYQYWKDQGKLAYDNKDLIWGGLWHRSWEHYEALIHGKEHYFCDVAHIQLADKFYVK